MYNNIFSIYGITIHGYGLMIGIGFAAAVIIARIRSNKYDIDRDRIVDFAFYSILFGLIGAKILYIIVNFKSFLSDPFFVIGSTGFVVYGGIIAGVFASYIFCINKNLNFLNYFDLFMPSVAVAQGFGRIGCFLAGCCYGVETDLPIGIVFPQGSLAPAGIKLFPTQLVSSAGDFALAVILIAYSRKKRRPGSCGFLYLFLYSIGRFFIEFLRADRRGTIGILSTSQAISLLIILSAIVIRFLCGKGRKEQP